MNIGYNLLKACMEDQPATVMNTFSAMMAERIGVINDALPGLVGQTVGSTAAFDYDGIMSNAIKALDEWYAPVGGGAEYANPDTPDANLPKDTNAVGLDGSPALTDAGETVVNNQVNLNDTSNQARVG